MADIKNLIYNRDFYNDYQKQRFLNLQSDNMRPNVARILSRAKKLEEQYGCDLYNFDLPQLEQFIKYLNPVTYASARSSCWIISSYIRWAIKEDLREQNVNPLDIVMGEEFLNKFTEDPTNRLFSAQLIFEIVSEMQNFQDRVLIHLLFEGVRGNNFAEIIALKGSDVIGDNRLRLTDEDGQIREIIVSDECVGYVKRASIETEYLKKNGKLPPTNRSKTLKLYDNEYVIKTVQSNSKNAGRIDKLTIMRRLSTLGEVFELQNFTAINLRYSGMLYMAKKLLDRDGVFEEKQMNEVMEQFGVNKVNNNGYLQYNYYNYKRDFLNMDMLNKIYPPDEE